MADGYPVRDAEPGKTRPCQYDDFCILLRGRSDFALYEAALTALDIPVYADVAADLLDAPHVRPLPHCCVCWITRHRMWSFPLCCSAAVPLHAG